MSHSPQRIVCLIEETTETLHLQGEEARIVDISGFADRIKARAARQGWRGCGFTGIGWVSELIRLAGGEDNFPEVAQKRSARQHIVTDPPEIASRAPDFIIGSWCGKKFRPERVAARHGWETIPAVRDGRLHAIKSCDILSPGPAALTDGLRQLHGSIARWHEGSAA